MWRKRCAGCAPGISTVRSLRRRTDFQPPLNAQKTCGRELMSIRAKYSIVVPMYNEEEVIEETHKRLKAVMDGTGEPYELVFVNDGSGDRTVEIVNRLCRE